MYAIHAQAPISSICGPFVHEIFGSLPKIKYYDHLIFFLSPLRRSVDTFATPRGGRGGGERGEGVKNLGSGWLKLIVLENKVVINFDFRHGAKKSGLLDHLANIWPNLFQYIWNILRKVG